MAADPPIQEIQSLARIIDPTLYTEWYIWDPFDVGLMPLEEYDLHEQSATPTHLSFHATMNHRLGISTVWYRPESYSSDIGVTWFQYEAAPVVGNWSVQQIRFGT